MSRAVLVSRLRHCALPHDRLRSLPTMTAVALLSLGFAGCSSDANRLTTGSISSSSPQQAYVPPPPPPTVSAPRVETRPMPAPSQSSSSLYGSYESRRAVAAGMGNYAAPSVSPVETTQATPPRSIAAAGGWTKDGGTAIIVGTADTVDIIAQRYQVPADAILKVNNLVGPRALQPGQKLIIPRRTAAVVAPATQSQPVASTPATVPASGASIAYVVKPGDTLMNLGRRHNVPAAAIARMNGLQPTSQLKIGSRISLPATAQVATAQPVPYVAQTTDTKQQVASLAPAAEQKARLATATGDKAADTTDSSTAKASDATSALPTFRWPVRGRVIAGFGAKTGGKQNDGINVAVPEGTPVKAAEDGVVAYAGNELKGFGNLILVRHANGYVSAYAHTSEVMVKRGDTIKRGQIIGKAGQTGDVSSPQLHFEIRKGSTPVDPQQFLNGA